MISENWSADLAGRFWSKTKLDPVSGCVVWQGAIGVKGYGQFGYKGRNARAHRVCWEIENGRPIPEGLVVMHTCDNPPCVNPGHLKVGTVLDNTVDMYQKGRRGLPRLTRPSAKLTSSKVEEIRNSPLRNKDLSEIYGVSKSNITLIQQRKTWVREG